MILGKFLFVVVCSCLAEATNTENQEFLDQNKKRAEISVTLSGLQYEIVGSGPVDGPHPGLKQKCSCHYHGILIDGTEFDSSYTRGKPVTIAPNQVIKGWKEALQLMTPGDKWKLYIPSELGYGEKGAGGMIPGGAALIFDIELLEIWPPGMIGDFLDQLGLSEFRHHIYILRFLMFPFLLFAAYRMWTYTGVGSHAGPMVKLENALGKAGNTKIYMNIKVGEAEAERIEIELFNGVCPRTAENFRALCTGEKGIGASGNELTFKGSKFHRIIPGFMAQGGDFTRGNGTGGESIYGGRFEDEWHNGHVRHTIPGLLSSANAGPNSNSSQFFITFAAATHLNGKHVVFGRVIEGMETVKKMEKVGSGGGNISMAVIVEDCGEVKTKST